MFKDLVAKEEISESALERHSKMVPEYHGPGANGYELERQKLMKRFKASFGAHLDHYVDKPF